VLDGDPPSPDRPVVTEKKEDVNVFSAMPLLSQAVSENLAGCLCPICFQHDYCTLGRIRLGSLTILPGRDVFLFVLVPTVNRAPGVCERQVHGFMSHIQKTKGLGLNCPEIESARHWVRDQYGVV